MQHFLNYINGELRKAISDEWIPVVNPSTAEQYAWLSNSGNQDVQQAVEAAQAASAGWARTSAKERSTILLRIANHIAEHHKTLALAESIDQGKPLWLAESVDIPRAEENMRFFATEILHTHTEAYQTDYRTLNYTTRSPLGVVGCISPWNLPLYLFTWKIAPALAAGNCVVAKPSELTPATAFLFSEICIQAGLPKGVLNVVHGYGHTAGAAIVEHPSIKAVSFTGGTATGKRIASLAAPQLKKLSLELGGKNPTIVCADVDIPHVAKQVARAAFTNQGEICLCGSRIFIERAVYTEFVEALVNEVRQFTVGNPLDSQTKCGALVSQEHMEKVIGYIDQAVLMGGTILVGGSRVEVAPPCQHGWFVAPTLIQGLPSEAPINQEEVFGPVATVLPFDTDQQVLEWANSTPYGLAASVFTTNIQRAHTLANGLQSGIVWINCWLVRDLRTPFGGVKQSGVGREGGTEALRFFTEIKNVCIVT
jgi:aminomuconate-semialdehyde/2-hydroxymuconate-6-semialdehyde dehydrogenase